MDENLRKKIRTFAEENGLDPDELEVTLGTDALPLELEQAMDAVLGDVGRFAQALDRLDK